MILGGCQPSKLHFQLGGAVPPCRGGGCLYAVGGADWQHLSLMEVEARTSGSGCGGGDVRWRRAQMAEGVGGDGGKHGALEAPAVAATEQAGTSAAWQ